MSKAACSANFSPVVAVDKLQGGLVIHRAETAAVTVDITGA